MAAEHQVTMPTTDSNRLNELVDVASTPRCQALSNLEASTNGGGIQEHGRGRPASTTENSYVLPKLLTQLTKKEKEEDFMAFKGSKLPLRPTKRKKLVQRKINLVCPGSLMGDLTLERYEVHDNMSQQRTGGLKRMRNLENGSD